MSRGMSPQDTQRVRRVIGRVARALDKEPPHMVLESLVHILSLYVGNLGPPEEIDREVLPSMLLEIERRVHEVRRKTAQNCGTPVVD